VLLEIVDLKTYFETGSGFAKAVDGVSLTVTRGKTLAVVGESGSGKTVTFLSVLGLVPRPPGRVVSGQAFFAGRDLLRMRDEELRAIRGKEIAVIFQDPAAALNPVFRVGQQLVNVIRSHGEISRTEAKARALDALAMVAIPRAAERFNAYPHELSGGMKQRVLIAMVLALRPQILIADEPTTALDVTIQAQILELLNDLRQELDMGLVLISHDLGIVAQFAQSVAVMYAGKIVEAADVDTVFYKSRHPYTRSLIQSSPRLDEATRERLTAIEGQPPSVGSLPSGCAFHPRCFLSRNRQECKSEIPTLAPCGAGHLVACHFAGELDASCPSDISA